MAKSKKGTVVVHERAQRLTLVWRYGGKRYYLSLGVPDSPINRKVADKVARQIEIDAVTGNFDPSLEKYRLPHQKPSQPPLRQRGILERFFATRSMDASTKYGYQAAWRYFKLWGGGDKVTQEQANEFVSWLAPKISPRSLATYVVRLAIIWDWGIEEKIFDLNPWRRIRVKIPPSQPKPFTKEEAERIIEAAKDYRDFVEFLFCTGCRLGEAIALRWENVSPDRSAVWILAKKTGVARYIHLSDRAQKVLERRTGNGYVFTSVTGRRIQRTNFSKRIWEPLLELLGIDYRRPYMTRHTFVTLALEAGVPPVEVSRCIGNSPAVLFKHYLGGSAGRVPDVF